MRNAFLTLSLLLLLDGCGGPRTWTVDAGGSGDYATIDAAMEAAKSGDTILIKTGTYNEELKIDKILTLKGNPEGEVVVKHSGTCVIVASDVTLEHLVVRETSTSPFDCMDVRLGTLTAEDCTLSSAGGNGLLISTTATARLKNCHLIECKASGISVFGGLYGEHCDISANTKAGLTINSVGSIEIHDSQINANLNDGITIDHSGDKLLIENNSIAENKAFGIMVNGTANPTVRGNKILNSGNSGIFVDQSASGIYERNSVTNSENEYAGITVNSTAVAVVTGNTIKGSFKGICAHGSGICRIEDNEVLECRNVGLCITGNADMARCRIHNNKENGVCVIQTGNIKVDGCEIFDNGFAFCVMEDGKADVKNCKIHGNSNNRGVLLKGHGFATLTNNEIYGNLFSGIELMDESGADLSGNRIHDNGMFAVEASDTNHGKILDNDMLNNRMGSWFIAKAALPHLQCASNREELGPPDKIQVGDWFSSKETYYEGTLANSVQLRYVVTKLTSDEISVETTATINGHSKKSSETFTKAIVFGGVYLEDGQTQRLKSRGRSLQPIGGREVDCTWEEYEVLNADGKLVEIVQVWHSLSLPFMNALKREIRADGKLIMKSEPLDFKVAATYK